MSIHPGNATRAHVNQVYKLTGRSGNLGRKGSHPRNTFSDQRPPKYAHTQLKAKLDTSGVLALDRSSELMSKENRHLRGHKRG